MDLPARAALLQAHPPESALERERRQCAGGRDRYLARIGSAAPQSRLRQYQLPGGHRHFHPLGLGGRKLDALPRPTGRTKPMRIAMRSAFSHPWPAAKPELPPAYRFLAHNRRIREKIENWRTRVRHHALADLDESLAAFYARHITERFLVARIESALARPGDAGTSLHLRSRTGWRTILGL